MSINAIKVLAGFLIGLTTLVSYSAPFTLTPFAPLVPGAVFAIFPQTRPMVVGTAIASCLALLVLAILGVYMSIFMPGTLHEAPQGTVR